MSATDAGSMISISSADSDLPSLEDKLSLVYSSIKKKLICECPAIQMFGFPCIHIFRVLSHMKEHKLALFEHQDGGGFSSLEIDDIRPYMGKGIC